MKHWAWIAVATAGWAWTAGAARAEDLRTRGGPTAEEVRVAAAVGERTDRDLPDCRRGCGDMQDDCGWPVTCAGRVGRWDITLEGTASWLEGPEGPLGEETGAVNAIRWDDLEYGVAFGGRAAVAVRLGTYDRVRARGWWLGGWDDDRSSAGVYGFAPPAAISPLSDVTTTSEADLWSVSVDWMRELACCNIYRLEGFVGPRITSFDETATANIVSLGVGPGPTALIRAEAENTFYGGEIGATFTAYADPRWTLGLQAGVLLGLLDREIRVDDSGLFTPGAKTSSADTDDFSWGVEFDASVTWHPTPRFGVTLGYQLFYLDDVTRANEAMDFGQFGTGQVQAGSPQNDVLVHTIFAGITVNL